ncbi:class I SAM-dependent methyltransferase [Vagococcus hydrophili]|uniref:Class I SAM-dependent methyltransferase n=1 Tax=Vagococcus hydrophili TaxID=2714947 RepID=A0A6G8ARA2_9ENTE|nr:class I SAM-dependent methyltransferase [Vagococcus hydrophili]QIL47455.1 class I SAM-dependent methyltransferase [Vagococcus hydrophili]
MYNHYGNLATTVYEITKPVGTSLNGDIDYYSERLEGITGKILEAGVGSGRMLIPLLEEGFQVEGVDQSTDMLAVCRDNLDKHHLQTSLHQDNLTHFSLGNSTFEAIILPTSTFCLIENEQLAYQTLTNFYQHLKVGGKLILDLDLPFYPEVEESTTTSFTLSETEVITFEKKIISIDFLEQHIVYHLTYSLWRHGELVKTELQQFLLRWYGLNEFKLMLEKVGFKNINVSSDYEFDVMPTDSNQTITFEAWK